MTSAVRSEQSVVQRAVTLVRQMSREELEELIRQVPALQQVKVSERDNGIKEGVLKFAGSWTDLSAEQLAALDEACHRRASFFGEDAEDRTW